MKAAWMAVLLLTACATTQRSGEILPTDRIIWWPFAIVHEGVKYDAILIDFMDDRMPQIWYASSYGTDSLERVRVEEGHVFWYPWSGLKGTLGEPTDERKRIIIEGIKRILKGI